MHQRAEQKMQRIEKFKTISTPLRLETLSIGEVGYRIGGKTPTADGGVETTRPHHHYYPLYVVNNWLTFLIAQSCERLPTSGQNLTILDLTNQSEHITLPSPPNMETTQQPNRQDTINLRVWTTNGLSVTIT